MEGNEQYWREKYYKLANKIYRQGAYYRGVAAKMKLKMEAPVDATVISQVERSAADMDYIFRRAVHGLPMSLSLIHI